MTSYILFKDKLYPIAEDKLEIFKERGDVDLINGQTYMFAPDATFNLEEAFWFNDLASSSRREHVKIVDSLMFGGDDES